jgi:hypothetical protein
MVLTRHRWRELGPIYLQFLCFAAVTAVFWAHTSHRVYLDVYLIVFAAYTLQVAWSKWGWAAPPTFQMSRAPSQFSGASAPFELAGLRTSVWQFHGADLGTRRSTRTPSHDSVP